MSRWAVHRGDALAVLRSMETHSVDAIVTDPPAGIGFMNAEWDKDKGGRDEWIAWLAEIFTEARRIAKPGAHALVWALPRTSHWTATGLEDAGWELRDRVSHLFGCLSDDTEILVDGEWCHFSQATKGRLALAFDVKKQGYAWLPIENLYVYQEDNLAFRLVSDATDQIVSRHHRCVVERDGEYVFRIAEEVAREREALVPVLEDLPGLLASLPLPQPLAGGAKQDVREGMRCAAALRGKAREVPHAAGCLPALRDLVPSEEQRADVGREVLLAEVQRGGAMQRPRRGSSHGCDQFARSCGLDGSLASFVSDEDERRAQPGVAWRGDDLQEARQLRRGPVRPMPGGPSLDGEEGRLRDGASARCGAGDGAGATAAGSGPSREPRSEGQPTREPRALRDEPRSQAVRGARFTRSDLVRVEPIHYRGIIWCIQIATGAFVARRNGKVFVTGNTGFPKSKNLEGDHEGWGTALKPAVEDWHLARAPFAGTVAANVAVHRTGALHIDACRVGTSEKIIPFGSPKQAHGGIMDSTDVAREPFEQNASGRWPAHLVLSHNDDCVPLGTAKVRAAPAWNDNRPPSSFTGAATSAVHHADDDGTETVERWECSAGCAVAMLDEQSGTLRPGERPANAGSMGYGGSVGWTGREREVLDSGGASRFFFCAKPSTAEREMGLDGFAPATTDDGRETTNDTAYQRGATMRRNRHPTVKSVALMRWLMRLITPPGGLVLDLFTGSGTTGIAAMCEGFRFVGIEAEQDFVRLASARIGFAAKNPRAFEPGASRKGERVPANQTSLFGETGT